METVAAKQGTAGQLPATQLSATQLPALRYLSSTELERCLPDVGERLDLAARALVALAAGDAEMPPKIGVHPRTGALLHAMPAWLRADDLVGLKWVAAYPANRERGVPAISGLIVLNDPDTGLPTWLMDAARVTAVRTAAVSGAAIRLFRPPNIKRVAILGAGVQARSHAEVLGVLVPDAELVLYDRNRDRAAAVVAELESGGQRASVADTAQSAAASAQVVVTAATLGAASQVMTPDWLAPGTLVVSVDFATYASAALARTARAFVVDDREQFLAYRASGHFENYPEPTATLGELLAARSASAAGAGGEGPILVNHLGVGLADVVFADAIARRASASGAGVELER